MSNDFERDLSECYQLKGEMTIPKQPSVGQGLLSSAVATERERAGGGSSMEVVSSGGDSKPHGSSDIDVEVEQKNSDDTTTSNEEEEEEEEDIEYLRKFFVMPDFHHVMKGFVKQEGEAFSEKEQVLTMESERFSVPELLFRPTDIGLAQAGVTEATAQMISLLHDVSSAVVVVYRKLCMRW